MRIGSAVMNFDAQSQKNYDPAILYSRFAALGNYEHAGLQPFR